MRKTLRKCNTDDIVANIKEHKDFICPKCGKVLLYRANVDLSRIYGIYCDNCKFNIKMTYKLP